jgi:hypothetical protein
LGTAVLRPGKSIQTDQIPQKEETQIDRYWGASAVASSPRNKPGGTGKMAGVQPRSTSAAEADPRHQSLLAGPCKSRSPRRSRRHPDGPDTAESLPPECQRPFIPGRAGLPVSDSTDFSMTPIGRGDI